MFSKTCEYGIRSVIYIATQSIDDKRVKIAEITKHSNTPTAFTAKILGILTKTGIVLSKTGPNGGFYMELDGMKNIKLGRIIDAIDGDDVYNGCAAGLPQCNHDHPCPMHESFFKVREELKKILETTSIYDMAMSVKSGKSILSLQVLK
jgi:Rrf2 family protein